MGGGLREIDSNLLSKQGKTTINLARDLLNRQEGERLPTVAEFSTQFNVGVGTVQGALKTLEHSQAILLDSRGHQGTFLSRLDRVRLWPYALLGTIVGAMPLPATRRLQGLATALYSQFNKDELPLNLVYVRGGRERLKVLLDGRVDFIVCSRLALDLASQDSQRVQVVVEFPPRSYVEKGVVVVRAGAQPQIRSGMKLGIDVTSYDQSCLTNAESQGIDVELVPILYTQLRSGLQNGLIDAAVWGWDEVKEWGNDFTVGPITVPEAHKLADAGCAALMVCRKEDEHIGSLLQQLISVPQVKVLQEMVLGGDITPTY